MLATGELLGGRYRLGPLVGQGGMADVHRGEDTVTGAAVAIKLLRRLPDGTPWSTREIDALERLDHPALVRLRDAGVHEGTPYLVLDLVEGCSLADALARGPLGTKRAIEVIVAVAEGLAHAHGRGVTHRDVKPGNILLDHAGQAHLADFGVARLTDGTATTGAGFVIGTAAYLAPEQVRAERAGPPADVYALGLVLLECVTGRRAYPGTFNEAAIAHLTTSPEIPPTVPPPLAAIITSATARDPSGRPSAAALAGMLRQPPESGPPTVVDAHTAVMEAMPRPAARRSRERRARMAIVAIAVGAIIGLAAAVVAVDRAGSGPPAPTIVTTTPTVPATAAPSTAVAPPVSTTTAAPPTTVRSQPVVSHDNKKGEKKGHG